jgi:hypothetical protein
MLENGADSPASSARFVRQPIWDAMLDCCIEKPLNLA